ncbi:MAG: DNA polymerase III subunit delta [Bacteroidales bacterium]|nr:DNA polymerase III subunit delta [Bacteroidales bacterium]
MTYEQIFRDLKNKIYQPVYFLMGEEPYFIDKITDYIINNILSEAEKPFNQIILYGKDVDIPAIITTSRRFPMMANQQLVVVKEAQVVKNIDDLILYINNPLKSTILVINYKYKTLDKRKKLYKALLKTEAIFESKKIYENKIPQWIEEYLKDKKYSITPGASVLLAEYLGSDLQRIVNELEKLTIILTENSKITPEHIEENIGISKDFNNFELQNAIVNRDILKANRIIDYFSKSPKEHPIIITITSLYFYFSKVLSYHFIKDKSRKNIASVLSINPFFVQDYEKAAKKYSPNKVAKIISLLREYDTKSKGIENVSFSHEDLLKEMLYKIIH